LVRGDADRWSRLVTGMAPADPGNVTTKEFDHKQLADQDGPAALQPTTSCRCKAANLSWPVHHWARPVYVAGNCYARPRFPRQFGC
jgi:hypothetical protein